jgi:hypothetical protein
VAVISSPQQRFLALFLEAEFVRLRVNWLDELGRVIGPARSLVDILPRAARVQAYILAGDGDQTFRGDAVNRRTLSVGALRELADCWEIPLHTLNRHGRELAATAAFAPGVLRNFRLAENLDRALAQRAKAEGRSVTKVLVCLVEAYLDSGNRTAA